MQFENGDEPGFTINETGDVGGGNFAKLGSSIALDTWHQLVGTFDGSTLTLYHNGTSVATATATQIGDASSWDVGIAENLQNTDRHLDATLDEIRVSSVSRSAGCVERLTTIRMPPPRLLPLEVRRLTLMTVQSPPPPPATTTGTGT